MKLTWKKRRHFVQKHLLRNSGISFSFCFRLIERMWKISFDPVLVVEYFRRLYQNLYLLELFGLCSCTSFVYKLGSTHGINQTVVKAIRH